MSSLEARAFTFVSGLVSALGYWGVIVAMALESAGIPIPSEIIMPLAGYQVKLGHFNFWAVVLAGTAGNVLGAMVAYGIGRGGGLALSLRGSTDIPLPPAGLGRADRLLAS